MNKQHDADDKGPQDQGDQERYDTDDDASPVPPTLVGWTVRLLSLALVTGLAGYLTYKASQPEEDFALRLQPEWDKASTRDGQYLVPVKVTNEANRPVRNLRIEIEPGADGPVDVEILLFGPGEGTTIIVPLDPGQRIVTHKVLSYEQ